MLKSLVGELREVGLVGLSCWRAIRSRGDAGGCRGGCLEHLSTIAHV